MDEGRLFPAMRPQFMYPSQMNDSSDVERPINFGR